MLTEIIFAALVIMSASLAGVLFMGRFGQRLLSERLPYLVTFSAGVFLVTSGGLALEVFEIYEGVLWMGIGLIVIGYGLAWLIEYLLPETHHHHDPACDHGHGKGAHKLIIGDAVHNIGDGIILVPAFLVSPVLGLSVAVSIFIHELLQEISEFFVLKQAGYSTKRALAINFLTASTILVGVGLSYWAVATHELEGVLLAVSAGFFLHVVLHDLLPKPKAYETGREFLVHVAVLVVGLVLMAGVTTALGESHSHGEAEGEHGHEHTEEHAEHGHEAAETGADHHDADHEHAEVR